jgi:hypothetical protein
VRRELASTNAVLLNHYRPESRPGSFPGLIEGLIHVLVCELKVQSRTPDPKIYTAATSGNSRNSEGALGRWLLIQNQIFEFERADPAGQRAHRAIDFDHRIAVNPETLAKECRTNGILEAALPVGFSVPD